MKKKKNLITLYLQAIVSIIAIVLLIMYFINNSYIGYLGICLGFDLLIMGYNNKLFYKRENMTLLYVFIGLALIIYNVVKLLGA